MIILVSGKMGAGKDTFASMIAESTADVQVLHYADYLKYFAKTFLNWSGRKDEEGRALLQTFGTDVVREKMGMPNLWVDTVITQIEILKHFGKQHFVIADVRFPNEIKRVKESYSDVITVRIETDDHAQRIEVVETGHSSETALDGFDFDFVISNNGTLEDLRKEALNLIRRL